jgi:hypothetical protein
VIKFGDELDPPTSVFNGSRFGTTSGGSVGASIAITADAST